MINQINRSSVNSSKPMKNQPQFKGGALDLVMMPLQLCEQIPMLNVTVLDLTTAIVPRTVIEGQTNVYSGFEAFRRESSGLIVNCLLPSFIVLGFSRLLKNNIMGPFSRKGADSQNKSLMPDCWANQATINKMAGIYKEADGATTKDKVRATWRKILTTMEGVDGDKTVKFGDLDKKALDGIIERLTEATCGNKTNKEIQKEIEAIFYDKNGSKGLSNLTKITKNIRFNGEKGFFGSSLDAIVKEGYKILREFHLQNITQSSVVDDFAKRAAKLVKVKSWSGMGVIIPLAIAMQPFNRWWTSKVAGKKGAPIYKDFEDSKEKELSPEQKATLHKQKAVSIGSMIGVALLSIMKMPSIAMAKGIGEFSAIFPTMDQARVISTATFASRMGSSEDANELKEATMRDIATFCSFYFIGDYVAKGTANLIEALHKGKVNLINKKEELKKGANPLEAFWHWMKKTELKATEEVLPEARKWRAVCQLSNIVFSLALLGLIIPRVYRSQTDKAREKELKEMGLDPKRYYPTFAMNNNAMTNSPAFKEIRTSVN